MPEKTSSRKKYHNQNHGLWQFVLLLVVLVAVTVTLAGTCLYRFIHRSDYEISLYQGLVSAAQSTTKSSSAKLNSTQAKNFNFKVSDDETVWSTETEIELFQASYKNENGEVTVQSADGKNVIAPGTGGSYTFSLKNAGKLNSNYQVWLSADMNVSSSDFPIEFRMSGADGWITGDDGAWKSADELNSAVAKKNLYAGKSDEYTLYWRWAYERDADAEDTAYGNMTVSQDGSTGSTTAGTMEISQTISYKITLHTLASEGLIGEDTDSSTTTPGTTAPDKDTETIQNNGTGTRADSTQAVSRDTTGSSKKPAKTGDDTPIYGWILLLGAAGMVIVFTGYRRRKDK